MRLWISAFGARCAGAFDTAELGRELRRFNHVSH